MSKVFLRFTCHLVVFGLTPFFAGCGSRLSRGGDPGPTNLNGSTNACGKSIVANQSFLANQLMWHDTGMMTGTSWLVDTNFQASTLTFGPYLLNLAPYMYKVTFQLKETSTDPLDSSPVAIIDVYDNKNPTFFASKTLYRNSFSSSGSVQDFTLSAYLPNECGSGIEGRVTWLDPAETAGNNTTLEHIATTFTSLGQNDYLFSGSNSFPMEDYVIHDHNTLGFAAWIKTTASGGVILGQNDVRYNNTPNVWNSSLYIGNDGRLYGLFADGQPLTSEVMASPTAINDGNWHHIALIADSSNASSPWQKLYVDGVAVGNRTHPIQNNQAGQFNQIGLGYTKNWPNSAQQGWEYFEGSMRDTRLFVGGGINDSTINDIFKNGP